MSLTAKGTATRQRILEGAAAHLRGSDPGNATLDDIREVTQISKSQLFHYFPGGKEELFLEVARLEADRVIEDQQPHLGMLDSWAAWDRWRKVVIARYKAQGPNCPLGSLMTQVGNVPGAAEVSTALLQNWRDHVERGIDIMQAKGEIDPSINPRRTAAAFIAGIREESRFSGPPVGPNTSRPSSESCSTTCAGRPPERPPSGDRPAWRDDARAPHNGAVADDRGVGRGRGSQTHVEVSQRRT